MSKGMSGDETRVSSWKKTRTRNMPSISVVMTAGLAHDVAGAWFHAKLNKVSAAIPTDPPSMSNAANSCQRLSFLSPLMSDTRLGMTK